MNDILNKILNIICEKNLIHYKKIRKNIASFDADHGLRAGQFLSRYCKVLSDNNQSLEYAVDCYLQMVFDTNVETLEFLRTGKYSSSSFEEVNSRVYANPSIMGSYLHGIALSQFLWKQHYCIFNHFIEVIRKHEPLVKSYLEIGGGHGLYISEAINGFGDAVNFDLIDISLSSINLAKQMNCNNSINYIHRDIMKHEADKKYDFITMGEVLEHVEAPKILLDKVYDLLNTSGHLYISVPTNAPMIDHIYLFNNANEIRQMLNDSGFEVVDEVAICAEQDLSMEKIEKFKIAMMYGAVLKKR